MKMVQSLHGNLKRQTNTQRVAKQHLKMHLRRIRNREYSRLRDMVPSIAMKEKVSKITVIEEAVKYIDELHQALFERLQCKGLGDQSVTETSVKDFIHTLIPANFFSNSESSNRSYEKQQKLPSYVLPRKHKGPGKLC